MARPGEPHRLRRPAHRPVSPGGGDPGGLPGDGQPVVLSGRLVEVARRVNRCGYTWAEAGLEVAAGQVIDVRVFPQLYQQLAVLVCEDALVTVSGRVDHRDGTVAVIASGVIASGVIVSSGGAAR